MSSMGGITLSQSGMLPLYDRVKVTQDSVSTDKEPKLEVDAAAPAEGVKVTISGAALKTANAQKSQNTDIEDSGLSDQVQKILKMIREIKKQIAEKQAEMAAVMADKTLSPEQARARLSGLQSALSGLQASLTSAQASLAKAMKDMSAGDAVKAASLAMK